jgi:hypothetical protein
LASRLEVVVVVYVERVPWKWRIGAGHSACQIYERDGLREVTLRRRLFLEAETGSHTIVPRGYHKA